MTKDEILQVAEFDARLPKYYLLQTTIALAAILITIPLIPLWWIIGRGIHQKQYEALSCVLTRRSLKINRGYLFKVQKTIPLDKITDLALGEGPILRWLGLCSLSVETAGGGHGSAMGQAVLYGVVDAEAFRDRVLEERDRVAEGLPRAPDVAATAPAAPPADADVLQQIRDSVKRIEELLRERG